MAVEVKRHAVVFYEEVLVHWINVKVHSVAGPGEWVGSDAKVRDVIRPWHAAIPIGAGIEGTAKKAVPELIAAAGRSRCQKQDDK